MYTVTVSSFNFVQQKNNSLKIYCFIWGLLFFDIFFIHKIAIVSKIVTYIFSFS